QTLDSGAARAAFAALQCGAGAIQAFCQAASALPSQGTPSPRAKGDQSGFSAERALLPAQALADPHASERLERIPPNFQGLLYFQGFASLVAGIDLPGEAHSALLREPYATAARKARREALRPPTPKRCSQQAEQLCLFPGLEAPGG